MLGRFDAEQIATEALLLKTGDPILTAVSEPIPNSPVFLIGVELK